MTSKKLLIATHNQGKVRELGAMLAEWEGACVSLTEAGVDFDVEETGTTFVENAILKGEAYARATGLWTLAEDSGLEVAALDGVPGVYTARYGGPGLSHEERYQHLLAEMGGVAEGERQAQFRCVMVLVNPEGEVAVKTEGICAGAIAMAPRGEGGFGYDPVFLLPERGVTMAEVEAAEKNRISHRAQAMGAMRPALLRLLGNG